jgi:hypothetical protein
VANVDGTVSLGSGLRATRITFGLAQDQARYLPVKVEEELRDGVVSITTIASRHEPREAIPKVVANFADDSL